MTSVSTHIDERAGAVQPTPAGFTRPALGPIRRLLGMLEEHRLRFWIATLALLGGSGIGLIYPQAARYVVDRGLSERSLDELNLIALALLGTFSLQAALTWVRHYLMSWLGERVVADLRDAVYRHVIRMEPAFYEVTKIGEVMSRLTADTTLIQSISGVGRRSFCVHRFSSSGHWHC